jgi:putative tryptophan/tyrosine transport system substrate-binding protein
MKSSQGLRRGLEDRGYVLGRNLVLEERYANGNAAQVPQLIAELLAKKVDVLVTPGTATSRAAQRATSTVPIVVFSADPVGNGLVESLAHPGANITGLSSVASDYSAKWLQLLIEAAPKVRRVAVLWNPDNPAMVQELAQMNDAARALTLHLTALAARGPELEASLAAIVPASVDGFVMCDDALLVTVMPRLIVLAADRNLPAIYGFSNAANQGGLMSYSIDFFDWGRQAGGCIDRILKGARPAEQPIEQATQIRSQDQHQDRKSSRFDDPTNSARGCRRGDRVNGRDVADWPFKTGRLF